jgi:hypothetical protein
MRRIIFITAAVFLLMQTPRLIVMLQLLLLLERR